jgi:flagellar biosynthesis/type III secretory pathway protein FliH
MGRVVKGLGHRVPGDVLLARQQASAILAAARAEAERLRAGALAEQESARQRGYADGTDAAAAEVTRIVAAVRTATEEVLHQARPTAVALAARMAARIVGRAVDVQPAVMTEIAAEALRASGARPGRVKLRVHPADRAAVVATRPALAARLASGTALDIVDDPTVGRYGCVVDTTAGRLDARLATQLAVLEQALTGEPEHG